MGTGPRPRGTFPGPIRAPFLFALRLSVSPPRRLLFVTFPSRPHPEIPSTVPLLRSNLAPYRPLSGPSHSADLSPCQPEPAHHSPQLLPHHILSPGLPHLLVPSHHGPRSPGKAGSKNSQCHQGKARILERQAAQGQTESRPQCASPGASPLASAPAETTDLFWEPSPWLPEGGLFNWRAGSRPEPS